MELTPKQLKVSKRLYRQNGGAVWWRVGTGKTRIAYSFFATIAKALNDSVVPRFLVVCRRESFYDWADEVRKCELNWAVREIECEDDLYRVRTKRPIVFLLSHGKLASMLPHLKDNASVIQGMALDEGFLYKNPATKHCKSANQLSTTIGRAIILSGSIMTARDPTDIYGQLYAINRHEPLGRTLTEFRTRYMFKFQINPERSYAAKYIAQRGANLQITGVIKSNRAASFYFPSNSERRIVECVRTIPGTSAQCKAFQSLREYYDLELRGELLELKNALSLSIKCQQISDGWIKMDSGIVTIDSAKLDVLVAQVAELISCGERVVIWTAFQHSVTLILQRLQKSLPSVKAYGMHGGMKFDVVGWQRHGMVAVATVGSGSSINHFRHCAYAIYYSHSYRWLDMQQSKGRTNRKDSTHPTCFYYFLQTEGSLDKIVYRAVKSSGKAEDEIIQQGVQSWLT